MSNCFLTNSIRRMRPRNFIAKSSIDLRKNCESKGSKMYNYINIFLRNWHVFVVLDDVDMVLIL